MITRERIAAWVCEAQCVVNDADVWFAFEWSRVCVCSAHVQTVVDPEFLPDVPQGLRQLFCEDVHLVLSQM